MIYESADAAELRSVRADLKRVTEECGVLKKRGALLQGLRLRYAFVREHRAEFRISVVCRLLRVHRSGNYVWLRAPMAARARENARLIRLILRA